MLGPGIEQKASDPFRDLLREDRIVVEDQIAGSGRDATCTGSGTVVVQEVNGHVQTDATGSLSGPSCFHDIRIGVIQPLSSFPLATSLSVPDVGD